MHGTGTMCLNNRRDGNQRVTMEITRTTHANGSSDDSLPIRYNYEGYLREGTHLALTWYSVDRTLVGAAVYELDTEKKTFSGKTIYYSRKKDDVIGGNVWLVKEQ